jgi:hypothetical protein
MKGFVALFLLLASQVMAAVSPEETVTVTAASLAGLWKITWPLSPRPGQAPSLATMYCRMEQAPAVSSVHCFGRNNGALTVTDGNLRILWSPPMTPQSNVIEAAMTSADSFAGSERVRVAGITILRSEGLIGLRQQIDPQAPDKAGKARQLRAILGGLANGAPKQPFENGALVELPDAETLRALGPIQSILYLAQANAWRDGATLTDFFSVYLVDFQNGNRLCGLHQRADGVLDAFRCA